MLSGGASRWRVCYQRDLPRLVKIKWKSAVIPFYAKAIFVTTQISQIIKILLWCVQNWQHCIWEKYDPDTWLSRWQDFRELWQGSVRGACNRPAIRLCHRPAIQSCNQGADRSCQFIEERSDPVIEERSNHAIEERSDPVIEERSDPVIDLVSDSLFGLHYAFCVTVLNSVNLVNSFGAGIALDANYCFTW